MTQNLNKLTIGLTMGDPAGIGAEVIVKALADAELHRRARFVVFGFSEQLAYTADRLELPFSFFRDHHEQVRRYPHDLVVLDYDEIVMPAAIERGPHKAGGQASMAFCTDAIEAARAGLIDAIVTAPISKQSWRLAGFRKYPGHTELLAEKFKVRNVAMMFVSPPLKVVLATIHEPLFEIRNSLTIGCVFNPIELADRALREWFGIPRPRLGVCGVNPHAGEEGAFGDEEHRIIAPAILMATEIGIRASGPYPADTVFLRALEGHFDCVVAMYHDQGLIPIKLLAWRDAVNVTLGLPNQPGPRHRVRHRRQEQGRRKLHEGGHPPGDRPRRAPGTTASPFQRPRDLIPACVLASVPRSVSRMGTSRSLRSLRRSLPCLATILQWRGRPDCVRPARAFENESRGLLGDEVQTMADRQTYLHWIQQRLHEAERQMMQLTDCADPEGTELLRGVQAIHQLNQKAINRLVAFEDFTGPDDAPLRAELEAVMNEVEAALTNIRSASDFTREHQLGRKAG